MSAPRLEIFEMYAQEHGSRLLKASDDARILRSLSRKSEPESTKRSIHASRPWLVNLLASLIYVFKQLPA